MSKRSMFDTLFVTKSESRVYPGFDWMNDSEVRTGYSLIIIDESVNPFKDYDGPTHCSPVIHLNSIIRHEMKSYKYMPELRRFVDDGVQTEMYAVFGIVDSAGNIKDMFRQIADFIEH